MAVGDHFRAFGQPQPGFVHVVGLFLVQLHLIKVTEGAIDQVPVPEPLPLRRQRDEFILQIGCYRFGHRLLLRVRPVFVVMLPDAFELVIMQAKSPLAGRQRCQHFDLATGSQQARADDQAG